MEKFQNEEAKKQIVMCSLVVKSVFICRADHYNGDGHVPSLYSSFFFFFTIGEMTMASKVFSITDYFSTIKDSNHQLVLQGYAFAFLYLNWLYPLYLYFPSCDIMKPISHL